MRELSDFVKTEFNKNDLFAECVLITNMDDADKFVLEISYGKYLGLKFKTSNLKEYFIDKLLTTRPDTNIINCNCTIECFNNSVFDGLLVFNNIKNCKYQEIINEIKQHKAVLIC